MRTFERKPLSWAKTEGGVRVHPGDEAELVRLGQSYKKRPVHPLFAKPDGTMIDGTRRVLGLRLIGEKDAEFLITDEELTPEQLLEIGLVTAIHRLDLSGFEKWQAAEKLHSLHPEWLGKDLAEYLHIDASMVPRLLSPGKCIAEAQEALAQGQIGISDTYALAKDAPEEQKRLLALRLSGASRDQLESEGRKRRTAGGQPGKEAVRTGRVKCELGGNVSIIVAGNALGLDEVIEALGAAQKEARKARQQNLDVRTWSAVMRDRAKKGG